MEWNLFRVPEGRRAEESPRALLGLAFLLLLLLFVLCLVPRALLRRLGDLANSTSELEAFLSSVVRGTRGDGVLVRLVGALSGLAGLAAARALVLEVDSGQVAAALSDVSNGEKILVQK